MHGGGVHVQMPEPPSPWGYHFGPNVRQNVVDTRTHVDCFVLPICFYSKYSSPALGVPVTAGALYAIAVMLA